MRLRPLLAATLLLAAPVVTRGQAARPALPAAPAPSAAAEEEAKIEGHAISRANGHYLGVELDGLRLRVTFYGPDKKKETADASRIAVRWDHPRQTGGFKNAVLTPESAEALASPGVFMPPHTYNVFLVLIGADEKPIENFVVNLGALPKNEAAAEPAAPRY